MSPTNVLRAAGLAAAISAGIATSAHAASASLEARGYQTFMSKGCYQCHGTVGQGGAAGPKVAPNPLPAQTIMAIIRKPIREMPPYSKAVVSDEEVVAIHAYLASVKPPPAVDSLVQLRPRGAKP